MPPQRHKGTKGTKDDPKTGIGCVKAGRDSCQTKQVKSNVVRRHELKSVKRAHHGVMLDRTSNQGQQEGESVPDSNRSSDVSTMHSATRTIIAAISLAALANGCAAPSPSPSPIPTSLPSIRFESIRFESGQWALSSAARQSIREAASLLKKGPGSTLPVIVEGHTDSSGDAAANEALSKVRAQSVANELVFNGIAPERITVRGYGDSRPVAPDRHPDGTDNPEARSRNRRVDVTIDRRPDGVGIQPGSWSR